jgi:tetratricopeptide (TPR) repeat protein
MGELADVGQPDHQAESPAEMKRHALTQLALLLLVATMGVGCAETQRQRASRDAALVRRETTPARLQARGEAAAMVGDFTRAEQYFVAALNGGGDERLLTTRLLVVCVTDGRYPAAANYGEDFLRRHPGDIEIRYAVASVYVALGDLARAREGLRRVVAERPDIADAHYALATLLLQEEDGQREADNQLREYIRLRPNGQYSEAARASLQGAR